MSRGMKIADLARNAGITGSYLSRLETGARRHMSPPTYMALRTALGLSPKNPTLLATREANTE
jgi:transcriptional regulator with XRE-family HTH domain